MDKIALLVPLLPLIGFIINGLLGKYIKNEKLIGGIATLAVGGSFAASIALFLSIMNGSLSAPAVFEYFNWISAGAFSIKYAFQIDQLSVLYAMVITGIGSLIHIYSIGYMHGDKSYPRFFAYLNLFIFMMLNLVLANNLLLTFFGWEGVGLSSYLLIGFWYDRKFSGVNIEWTGDAANKAFITNRIGDFGVLLGMFILFLTFNTLDYIPLIENAKALASANSSFIGGSVITIATLSLFLGATGKSAQLPLSVWLPDAMAGPTPVSALIHAATMVTAGIFLIARLSFLFALAPFTMGVIATVGIITAFTAATVGLVQNDIKKVLAYSTVSQLGFMFIALGVGAFSAGVFHVMTHAFFKGLLFLGAGSVIHAMHDEQDIQKMGGLKKYAPKTYLTFLIGAIAISGIPPFAGFFSKDEILWNAYDKGSLVMWIIGASAAFCTAFYMFRLVNLTFHGEERFDHKKIHPHESPSTMTMPLIILAILSALGGFLGVPYSLGFFASNHPNLLENWLHPIFKDALEIKAPIEESGVHLIEYILMALSVAIAIFGINLANKFYKQKSKTPAKLAHKYQPIYKLLFNKYYLDEFYFAVIINPIVNGSRNFLWKIADVKIIDGAVNALAKLVGSLSGLLRKTQSGLIQNYALTMVVGVLIIIGWALMYAR